MPLNQPDHFPKFEIDMPVAVAFASGVSVSVLAVLLLVYSFNSGPDKPSEPKRETAESPNHIVGSLESPNRIVGGTREPGKPCAEQAWPYIEQKCLTAAPPKERVVAAPKPNDQALSPNIEVKPQAAIADNKPAEQPAKMQPVTDGVSAQSEHTPAVAPPQAAPAPQPEAAKTAVKSEPRKQEASLVIPPAQAAEQPNVAPRRKAKAARPAREQTARAGVGDPERIVRRWREVEYEGADGSTRKVIYVTRGTLQREFLFRNGALKAHPLSSPFRGRRIRVLQLGQTNMSSRYCEPATCFPVP